LIGPANAPAATSPRSVLFAQSPEFWGLGARDHDPANLDQAAWSLGPSELPISKSGQPIDPPRPQLSTAQEQALYAARLLSPNLVDYFTKTLPPPAPFPSTPGKISSLDNPYAVLAVLEAAPWLVPEARIAGTVTGAVERGVAQAVLQAAKSAAPGTLRPEALGRISTALRAAADAGNLTQQQAAVLRQRAIDASRGAAGLNSPTSQWLPKFDGETTYGVLITNEGNVVPLRSGQSGRFWNYPSAKHVEGKAAIWIGENGSSGGVVYHNNADGTCGFCNTQIRRLLPKQARLDVVSPSDAVAKNSMAKTGLLEYQGDETLPKVPPPLNQYEMFGKQQ
jgi:hypothetical protein